MTPAPTTASPPTAAPPTADPFRVGVCTLFEGDYHLGVAALLNSLHAGGFRGRFWVGYRGPLPPWLQPGDLGGVDVRPVELGDGLHLSHRKPAFMADLLRRDPDAAGVCYFDPDIVNLAAWRFYADWVSHGVAVCEDCTFPRLPATHPWRPHWRALLDAMGRPVRHERDDYLNSGFVGVSRGHAAFLDDWAAAMAAVDRLPGVNPADIRAGVRADPFCVLDQDALNVAAMATDVPLSVIGPDGMGFTPGGFVMLHAVGRCKPWRCRYVRQLARYGGGPGAADRAFWRHVRGVADPLPARRVAAARADLLLATVLSRFYGR